jgi:hypothetical protein
MLQLRTCTSAKAYSNTKTIPVVAVRFAPGTYRP